MTNGIVGVRWRISFGTPVGSSDWKLPALGKYSSRTYINLKSTISEKIFYAIIEGDDDQAPLVILNTGI